MLSRIIRKRDFGDRRADARTTEDRLGYGRPDVTPLPSAKLQRATPTTATNVLIK
jgi:hypothetical protein